jgi:hypothetical protein
LWLVARRPRPLWQPLVSEGAICLRPSGAGSWLLLAKQSFLVAVGQSAPTGRPEARRFQWVRAVLRLPDVERPVGQAHLALAWARPTAVSGAAYAVAAAARMSRSVCPAARQPGAPGLEHLPPVADQTGFRLLAQAGALAVVGPPVFPIPAAVRARLPEAGRRWWGGAGQRPFPLWVHLDQPAVLAAGFPPAVAACPPALLAVGDRCGP